MRNRSKYVVIAYYPEDGSFFVGPGMGHNLKMATRFPSSHVAQEAVKRLKADSRKAGMDPDYDGPRCRIVKLSEMLKSR